METRDLRTPAGSTGGAGAGTATPALFIAAALAVYGVMGSHLNGQPDLLIGPTMGTLLMIMLLLSFLPAYP